MVRMEMGSIQAGMRRRQNENHDQLATSLERPSGSSTAPESARISPSTMVVDIQEVAEDLQEHRGVPALFGTIIFLAVICLAAYEASNMNHYRKADLASLLLAPITGRARSYGEAVGFITSVASAAVKGMEVFQQADGSPPAAVVQSDIWVRTLRLVFGPVATAYPCAPPGDAYRALRDSSCPSSRFLSGVPSLASDRGATAWHGEFTYEVFTRDAWYFPIFTAAYAGGQPQESASLWRSRIANATGVMQSAATDGWVAVEFAGADLGGVTDFYASILIDADDFILPGGGWDSRAVAGNVYAWYTDVFKLGTWDCTRKMIYAGMLLLITVYRCYGEYQDFNDTRRWRAWHLGPDQARFLPSVRGHFSSFWNVSQLLLAIACISTATALFLSWGDRGTFPSGFSDLADADRQGQAWEDKYIISQGSAPHRYAQAGYCACGMVLLAILQVLQAVRFHPGAGVMMWTVHHSRQDLLDLSGIVIIVMAGSAVMMWVFLGGLSSGMEDFSIWHTSFFSVMGLGMGLFDLNPIARPIAGGSWAGASWGTTVPMLKWLTLGFIFITIAVIAQNVCLAVLLQGYNVHLEKTAERKRRHTLPVTIIFWVTGWVQSKRECHKGELETRRFSWRSTDDAGLAFAALVSNPEQKAIIPAHLAERLAGRERAGQGRILTLGELAEIYQRAGIGEPGSGTAAPLSAEEAARAAALLLEVYGREAGGPDSVDGTAPTSPAAAHGKQPAPPPEAGDQASAAGLGDPLLQLQPLTTPQHQQHTGQAPAPGAARGRGRGVLPSPAASSVSFSHPAPTPGWAAAAPAGRYRRASATSPAAAVPPPARRSSGLSATHSGPGTSGAHAPAPPPSQWSGLPALGAPQGPYGRV